MTELLHRTRDRCANALALIQATIVSLHFLVSASNPVNNVSSDSLSSFSTSMDRGDDKNGQPPIKSKVPISSLEMDKFTREKSSMLEFIGKLSTLVGYTSAAQQDTFPSLDYSELISSTTLPTSLRHHSSSFISSSTSSPSSTTSIIEENVNSLVTRMKFVNEKLAKSEESGGLEKAEKMFLQPYVSRRLPLFCIPVCVLSFG